MATRPGFSDDAWVFALDAEEAITQRFYAATVPLSELDGQVTTDMIARGVWVDETCIRDDEPSIRYVAELADGRYVLVDAGCDYTGWDCRSSAHYIVGALEQVVRHLDPEERAAFDAAGVTS